MNKDVKLSELTQDGIAAAYELLNSAIVTYEGREVGTIASQDTNAPAANYAECFVRDFVPSAIVFLLDGRTEIVRNFLQLILHVRDMQEELAGHHNLPRVMPASFRVTVKSGKEELKADFGDRAIGRVAPVDSMMWWIILLDFYVRTTGDWEFAHSPECQRGIRMIMGICLRDRFEVFPTLLVPDASFMIDRRMGVFGHPLEIQSLFYASLSCAQTLLVDTRDNQPLLEMINQRKNNLIKYVHDYYWLDAARLNEIHRFENELFGKENSNAFNIYPESVPDWVADWLPEDGGYLVGNLSPGRLDVRFFAFGNLLAVLFGLASKNQAARILEVFEMRWPDLVGMMPIKICYPAMQGTEWHLMTGSDPKNTPWSYHNGGNWPCLLWTFVSACLNLDRKDLALRAMDIAYHRLPGDHWPEYYDGRSGRLVGRRANYNQIWSASSLIISKKLVENPSLLKKLGMTLTE